MSDYTYSYDEQFEVLYQKEHCSGKIVNSIMIPKSDLMQVEFMLGAYGFDSQVKCSELASSFDRVVMA